MKILWFLTLSLKLYAYEGCAFNDYSLPLAGTKVCVPSQYHINFSQLKKKQLILTNFAKIDINNEWRETEGVTIRYGYSTESKKELRSKVFKCGALNVLIKRIEGVDSIDLATTYLKLEDGERFISYMFIEREIIEYSLKGIPEQLNCVIQQLN